MSRMQEEKIRQLETDIKALKEQLATQGRVIDSNAQVLIQTASATQALCDKIGITNEDIKSAYIKAVTQREPDQSEQAGSPTAGSGDSGPTVLSAAGGRIDQGESESSNTAQPQNGDNAVDAGERDSSRTLSEDEARGT